MSTRKNGRSGWTAGAAVGLMLLLPAGSASADCRGGATARIVVTESPFSYGIDRGKRIEELTRMHSPGRSADPRSVMLTQGLFTPNLKVSSGYNSSTSRQPDGSWCAEATAVAMAFGDPTRGTVFVARNFPEGSCAYAAVLEHELKHVDQHRAMLRHARTWLRSHFAGWSPSARGKTLEDAQAELQKLVRGQIDAAFTYAEAYYRVNVDLIDTREEYARVDAQCVEWHRDGVDLQVLRR